MGEGVEAAVGGFVHDEQDGGVERLVGGDVPVEGLFDEVDEQPGEDGGESLLVGEWSAEVEGVGAVVIGNVEIDLAVVVVIPPRLPNHFFITQAIIDNPRCLADVYKEGAVAVGRLLGKNGRFPPH